MKRAVKYFGLILSIIALFFGIAYLVGGKSFTRSAMQEIEGSPQTVMLLLTDSNEAKKWMSPCDQIVNSAGDTRTILFDNQRIEQKLTCDKNHFSIETDHNGMRIHDTFKIIEIETESNDSENAPHRVEVSRVTQFEYSGWQRLIAPFIRNAASKRMHSELVALKKLVEEKESTLKQ